MVIEQLTDHHDRKSFDCGTGRLNQYLAQYARQDFSRHLSVTYVAVEEAGDSQVLGFYSLAMGSALPDDLVMRKLPQTRPVPVVLLGQLAVDGRCQGRGLGGILLIDALRRSLHISSMIGAAAIIVDALDEPARGFYLKHGFHPFKDAHFRLFVSIAEVEGFGIGPPQR